MQSSSPEPFNFSRFPKNLLDAERLSQIGPGSDTRVLFKLGIEDLCHAHDF
jgi:hypothetical protein